MLNLFLQDFIPQLPRGSLSERYAKGEEMMWPKRRRTGGRWPKKRRKQIQSLATTVRIKE